MGSTFIPLLWGKKIFTYFFSKYLVSAFSGPAVLMLAVQWGGCSGVGIRYDTHLKVLTGLQGTSHIIT